MKETVINILNKYLKVFPNEIKRISQFKKFIDNHTSFELVDWNNFDGHIVSSGFIYAKKERKFLFLFHKEFQMYVYPGGHVENNGETILDAALREIKEQTGLFNINEVLITDNPLVPLDIDTQFIPFNKRLNLPEHYHFDFRYLFTIDKIEDVSIDLSETSQYKWFTIDELKNNSHLKNVINKIEKYI